MSARKGRLFEAFLFLFAAASFLLGYLHAAAHPAPFAPGVKADDVLRVVTWNVGGSLDAGGTELRDDWIEHVAAVLRELEADVVLLQEVASGRQLARLRRRIGRRWQAVGSSGDGRRVAVLASRGALEVPARPERDPRA